MEQDVINVARTLYTDFTLYPVVVSSGTLWKTSKQGSKKSRLTAKPL